MNDPKSGSLSWYLPDPRAILRWTVLVSRSLAKRARRVTDAQYSHNHALKPLLEPAPIARKLAGRTTDLCLC